MQPHSVEKCFAPRQLRQQSTTDSTKDPRGDRETNSSSSHHDLTTLLLPPRSTFSINKYEPGNYYDLESQTERRRSRRVCGYGGSGGGGGGGGGSGRGLVGLACAAVLLCSILCAACVLVTVYFLLADMESQIEQRVLHRIEASKTSHDAALSDQRALVFGGEGLEPIPSAQKWKRSAEIVPEKKKGQRKKNRKGGKGRRHRKGRKKGKGRGRKGQGRRGRGQGHHRERRQTTSWNLAVFAHLASAGDLNENHAMEHRPVNRRVYSFFLWKRPEGLPLVNAQGISLEYSTVPRTDLVSGISVTSPGLYLIHSQVLVAGRQAGNAFIDCAHQTFVHSGRTGEIKSVAKSLVTQHNLGRSFHHGFDAEKYALDSASHSRLIFLNPNDIVRVGVHQHCSHYWYKQSDVAAYFEIVKL